MTDLQVWPAGEAGPPFERVLAVVAHPDHRALGRAVLDAIYPSARDAPYFPDQIREEGLSPWRVDHVWLFSSSIADFFVDVSEVLEARLAARLEHATQVRDPANLRER